MSRVDDRIKARLNLEIGLRLVGVTALLPGAFFGSLWGVQFLANTLLGSEYAVDGSLLLLCAAALLPGIVLLTLADGLSRFWVPIRSHAMCPRCDYPRDDPERKTCPDCAYEFFPAKGRVPLNEEQDESLSALINPKEKSI